VARRVFLDSGPSLQGLPDAILFLVGPVARRVFLDSGPSLQGLPDAILSLFRKGVACREA